ncbi:uncharacterized protein LOC123309387 isoform X2 [Coccinella septempunctata]|uniref:uncharacterized protein LOC123309387 isoform X1 n=1 Tax=Coccinella septempunctata TaxID=41139 RepID=UPI001D067E68|nr:uncharacterized protein LOC123309387 isoform X1 [Coccinella septempunctata]XP_044748418.1 uncharacterized protein LOC123309387 isoform X2 [Coccinella septempunctata]
MEPRNPTSKLNLPRPLTRKIVLKKKKNVQSTEESNDKAEVSSSKGDDWEISEYTEQEETSGTKQRKQEKQVIFKEDDIDAKPDTTSCRRDPKIVRSDEEIEDVTESTQVSLPLTTISPILAFLLSKKAGNVQV